MHGILWGCITLDLMLLTRRGLRACHTGSPTSSPSQPCMLHMSSHALGLTRVHVLRELAAAEHAAFVSHMGAMLPCPRLADGGNVHDGTHKQTTSHAADEGVKTSD